MLPEPDPALCRALAADLGDAGFAADALRAAWGDMADTAIARGLRGPADRSLGDRLDPLAVLGRLLVLGMPQPTASVAAALPRTGAEGLARLGLARGDGDRVFPQAIVRPQSFADDRGSGQWWIASDLDEAALGGALPEDHVLGVGGASLTLAALQLPTPVARGLDVGAGCGIQALRARRDIAEVVATDVSENALRYTRLNALLNGVDGIRTRRGSLFDPWRGSSSTGWSRIRRSSSRRGSPVCRRTSTATAGCRATTSSRPSSPAWAPISLRAGWPSCSATGRAATANRDSTACGTWVAASSIPLDAWVIERETLDPLSYAELWIRDGGTLPGTPEFAALVGAWLDDFSARNVQEVGFGYVLLRRPIAGATTLERYERVPQALDPGTALGAHYAAALAAHDRLAALDDDELAASVLVVSADVTEARHHLPGVESPSVIELRQGGGFARTIGADPGLAALVGACDGDLPVGVLIDAIGSLLEVDTAELRAELLPAARELVFTGFLRFDG